MSTIEVRSELIGYRTRAHTLALQDFDRAVKTALGKGRALSSSTVDSLVKLAMANVAVSSSTSCTTIQY